VRAQTASSARARHGRALLRSARVSSARTCLATSLSCRFLGRQTQQGRLNPCLFRKNHLERRPSAYLRKAALKTIARLRAHPGEARRARRAPPAAAPKRALRQASQPPAGPGTRGCTAACGAVSRGAAAAARAQCARFVTRRCPCGARQARAAAAARAAARARAAPSPTRRSAAGALRSRAPIFTRRL